MSYFIGKLQKKETKNGKTMFEGRLNFTAPIKGFFEKKNPDILHLAIDGDKFSYLIKASDKPRTSSVKEEKEQPQEELQEVS